MCTKEKNEQKIFLEKIQGMFKKKSEGKKFNKNIYFFQIMISQRKNSDLKNILQKNQKKNRKKISKKKSKI